MILSLDHSENPQRTENPTLDKILSAIKSMNGADISYFILDLDNGDYIQCAGGPEIFTLEYRIYDGDKFKHFVLGPVANNNGPLKTVWVQIKCKVGPINIHEAEIMKPEDLEAIFTYYFGKGELSKSLNFRNVTKMFEE